MKNSSRSTALLIAVLTATIVTACGSDAITRRRRLGRPQVPEVLTYKIVAKDRVAADSRIAATAVEEVRSGYMGYVDPLQVDRQAVSVTLSEAPRTAASGEIPSAYVIDLRRRPATGVDLKSAMELSGEIRPDTNPWLMEQAKKRLPATKSIGGPVRVIAFHATALTLHGVDGKALPRPPDKQVRGHLAQD